MGKVARMSDGEVRQPLLRTMVFAILCLALTVGGAARSKDTPKQPLTIDDLFDLHSIDRAAISPDGEWAVVVVSRAAGTGEV